MHEQNEQIRIPRQLWGRVRAVSPIHVGVLGGFAALLACACVNIMTQNAPSALQTAQSRARFELNCPGVTASILSQKIVQGWRFEGSEYTIGVRGCGRQAVYMTYCSEPSNCNAFSQTGRQSNLSNLMP